MEDFKSAPLTVDPGEVLYQCYGTLWYPNGSLWWERKLVWMQVLSLASEPPGKKGLEVLQSVLLIRRQLVSKDPDQKLHWWVLERERERGPVPLGWKDESSQHKVLLGISEGERVFPEDRGGFFTRWRTKTVTLYHSPKCTLWKYANGYQLLVYPGKPLGVGFREILHIVWSDDTHCNTLFAFISWTFLFLRGAGCFCGCRLHTWTGLGWFI